MANSLTATIAKVPDGDVSFGSKAGEIVTLSDSPSSYPTGGYPFQSQGNYNNQLAAGLTPLPVNVDLWKIDTVQTWANPSGYTLVWQDATQSLVVQQTGNTNAPNSQVPAGTDLSGFVFKLCVIGT